MARYHLYFLRGNMLLDSEHIEAASDFEAARIARERGDGQGDGRIVEVWNAQGRVRVVASAPADSRSAGSIAC